jgi:hypothetical protein
MIASTAATSGGDDGIFRSMRGPKRDRRPQKTPLSSF